MRNTAVMERSSKHKKKKCRSPSVDSSEEASSESDEKVSRNVETKRRHSSNSSDSSPERVKKHKKKKKKHKRKHKQPESEDDVEEVHIEKSNSPELVELEQGRGRRAYSEEGEASPEVERRDVNRRKDEDRRRHEQRRHREQEVDDERRDLSRRNNVDEERRRPEKRREDIAESYAAVRIKHEPVDEEDNRMRHSHSSSRHRPTDGRQRERSDNAEYQSSRHRHHRGEGHRSRPQDRGDHSSSRPDESGDRGHDSRRHNEDRPRFAAADGAEPANARPPQREQRRQSEERTNDGADRGRAERGGRGRGRAGGSRFNAKAERGGGDDDPAGGGTFEWGKAADNVKQEAVPPGEKEKPDFGTSGKLTAEANTFKGVVIKYSEPPEARKPRRRWRFYPFKGEKGLQTLYIHRQSSYLVGRDRKIADIPVDHPSCSKQHAALQYRLVPFDREDGTTGKRVRPYIIDLESANGTFVNNVRIDAKKYVELLERDVVKFGFSSREYVLLHEHSKDDDYDDVGDIEEGPEVEAREVIREVAEGTQRAAPVRLQPLAPLID